VEFDAKPSMIKLDATRARLAIALFLGVPVSVVFVPQLLPLLWKIGGSLIDDLARVPASDFVRLTINSIAGGTTVGSDGLSGARRALDTAAYFLWALLGVVGLGGFWIWVLAPLRSRKRRILVGICIFAGVVAAIPWTVSGARAGDWIGLLLAVTCLAGTVIAIRLAIRPSP